MYSFDCCNHISNSENIIIRLQKCLNSKHIGQKVNTNFCIGGRIYQQHVFIEEIDIAIRIVQAEWYQLQDMVFYNRTIPLSDVNFSREVINMTFHEIFESLQSCKCPSQKERYLKTIMNSVNKFSASVVQLSKLEDDILLKLLSPSVINLKNPIYQYIHVTMDIWFYILILEYLCGQPDKRVEERITKIMEDLVTISKNNYKRNSQGPFLCTCTKEFWLILQFFIESFLPNKNFFWETFNNLLEKEDNILFSLWLLKHISQLEVFNEQLLDEGIKSLRIKPNYDLLQLKLKLLLVNASSSTIVESFKIIEPLLSCLWLKHAKIEVYQIIWDYFSRRLNVSNKRPPNNMLELNELVDTILLSQTSCNEDFEMFLSMLILHLREHPSHWGKMKGRIYSQLGPNKLKDLNEIGLTHVMTLFLALTGISFDEVPKKMISVVENLRIEQRNTNLVWNAYAVLIIIHVREGRSIEKITPLMLQMLQDAASDEKTFFLIKNFVLNFEHIIKFSKNMHLSQWLLINTWFPKYVATCYYVDLKVAMDVILYVLDSVSNSDSWLLWESSFRQYICPSLKQLSNASKAPDVIGKIAGKLFLLVPNLGSEFFNYFNSENISAKISYQFLNLILDHYPNNFGFTPQQESVVIQSWLKICLLTSNVDEHFTNNVSKLDSFPATLKQHLTNSKNPVRAFIEYLGSDVRQHALSNDIIKLCDISFGRIDKWLTNYVTHPEDEAIIFHIYYHISLAFLHCGILLYDRNKGMSPLTKLVQVVLLPNSFLIGKAPHIFILNAVKKTWHIFFEAIVKLNIIPDTFLERTLRDMIVKYMPYFSTTESPIIKCFESDITTASVILEKLSNLYFRQPVKESDANVLKALHIVSHFMQSTTSATSMTLVVSKILFGLFEVIIFHSHKNIAQNLVNIMTCSPFYQHFKVEFSKSILAITEKHLQFNTSSYFQLMYVLVKFIPGDIKLLMGDIKKNVFNVERMRGVGCDENLRLLLEKLENSLK